MVPRVSRFSIWQTFYAMLLFVLSLPLSFHHEYIREPEFPQSVVGNFRGIMYSWDYQCSDNSLSRHLQTFRSCLHYFPSLIGHRCRKLERNVSKKSKWFFLEVLKRFEKGKSSWFNYRFDSKQFCVHVSQKIDVGWKFPENVSTWPMTNNHALDAAHDLHGCESCK